MLRPRIFRLRRVATRLGGAAFAVCCLCCGSPEPGRDPSPATEWRTRGGDAAGTEWRTPGGDAGYSRYSPLDQIDTRNFRDLEIAWEWASPDVRWKKRLMWRVAKGKGAEAGPAAFADITSFQVAPLVIDGVLYGVTPVGRVFALDAGTGETLWTHDPRSYAAAREPGDFLLPKQRGVTWWSDGSDARIFVATFDAHLLALDARTGEPVESFGSAGRVDLMEGLRGPPARRLADVFHTSPPALYEDVLIVGSSIQDYPHSQHATPGDLRAYDARSGARLWTFHVVPTEGEPGVETWEEESWRYSGAANVWGSMTVDEDRGLLFAPTSAATNDYYGGHRLGDNLYSQTLLCLDARSGRRVWHRQLIHHGLWDYDLAAPPNLVEIEVEGRRIAAVVQPTKQGFVFVFERETGTPVWPIEERPVPASDVPGERAARTQPFPTRPPPFERQGALEENLNDFTPALRAEALEVFRRYRTGPLFTPPSLRGTLLLPGPDGGANWRGAAWDPVEHWLYVPSITRGIVLKVVEGASVGASMRYLRGPGEPADLPMSGDPPVAGLPIFKPPWSRITAIDLDRGEIVWQVANGEGPRDHPALRGLDLPPLGSGNHTGVLVTPRLVVVSDGAPLWGLSGYSRPLLRAFDKRTGAMVSEVELPGLAQGNPITYLHGDRQFIAVAVANEVPPWNASLVALALPSK